MKQHIAAALAMALVLGGSSLGFAQEADTDVTETTETDISAADNPEGLTLSEIEPAEGFTNDTINDEKVDSFIQAVSMIGRVGAHYSKLVQDEADEDRRAFLIETANQDIVRAIAAVPNITPAEFVAIDQASQSDDVLNDRILTRIKQVQAENRPKERLLFSIPAAEPEE
ncbi:MAG: hypothetical protein AAFN80_09005 [Pseudomonadota bacterium]